MEPRDPRLPWRGILGPGHTGGEGRSWALRDLLPALFPLLLRAGSTGGSWQENPGSDFRTKNPAFRPQSRQPLFLGSLPPPDEREYSDTNGTRKLENNFSFFFVGGRCRQLGEGVV